MLPFFKTEWHTKFQNDANNPVCPKYRTNLIHSSFFLFSRDDENAHDMYIPAMGFITYILLAGYSIGLHGDFSPEKLGEYASGATGWLILEVLVTLMVIFLLQVVQIVFFNVYRIFRFNQISDTSTSSPLLATNSSRSSLLLFAASCQTATRFLSELFFMAALRFASSWSDRWKSAFSRMLLLLMDNMLLVTQESMF